MQEVRLIGKPGICLWSTSMCFLILKIVSNVSFSHSGVGDVLVLFMLDMCCSLSQGSCFFGFRDAFMEC